MAEGYEVYKVVRKEEDQDEDKLVSCFAPPELEINYQIGKKSFPKVGKLFCFDNLKSAIDFVKDMSFLKETVILLCETNSVVGLNHVELIPDGNRDDSSVNNYTYFWKSPKIWQESNHGNSIPDGTVFCEYVIPIEFVDPKEVYSCM